MVQMAFSSSNQQCQSTEGNLKHWSERGKITHWSSFCLDSPNDSWAQRYCSIYASSLTLVPQCTKRPKFLTDGTKPHWNRRMRRGELDGICASLRECNRTNYIASEMHGTDSHTTAQSMHDHSPRSDPKAMLVGWLVGWGLTALLTQNRSYRACRFVGIFYSKL